MVPRPSVTIQVDPSLGLIATFSISTDGKLWAWGDNASGQLGLDHKQSTYSPTQIGSDSNWLSITAGYDTFFAKKDDDSLWAWGNNFTGELGVGFSSMDSIYRPTRVQLY